MPKVEQRDTPGPQAALVLEDLGDALSRPFPVDRIGFLPKGAVQNKEKTVWKAKAFPFAEVWDYTLRLNECAYGGWSVDDAKILPLKDRLVVLLKLVVCGKVTWGVGEEMVQGTTTIIDESAVRSAWSQAFKRACTNFGLGLYLYFLGDPEYVEIDPLLGRTQTWKLSQWRLHQKR